MSKVKASDHESYNTFTLIAFILPIIGVILGVAYLAKDRSEDRKLGEHLVAISIFFALMQAVFLMIFWDDLFATPTIYNTPGY